MDRRQALRTLALGAASFPLAGDAALAALAAQSPGGAAPAAPAAADGPFTLPPLPYAFDALEPHLDAETMRIHHDRHHAAYVAGLNKAVAGRAEVAGWPLERLVADLAQVPEAIRGAVRNHGGGHANHSLFWTILRRDGARAPRGELARAIDAAFGSFATLGERLTAAATGVFGSGWAWLTTDAAGALRVETTPNQDSPLTAGRTPIAGIDVWEHAYYLRYQNRRAEYLAAVQKVLDWDAIAARYGEARKG